MEKNYGRELKRKVDSKSNLTRREFLKTTGKIALVGMASTGPFYLKGPFAYGAEATIEDLTKGKVHIGDRITVDKVGMVRDLISECTYDKMTKGLELVIAPKTDSRTCRDPAFWEATGRNKGRAMLDKGNNLWTKEGKPWAGGFPFPEPKTGLEVMFNALERYGALAGDDYICDSLALWINSKGVIHRTARNGWMGIHLQGRTMLEPFGIYPGYERETLRMLIWYTEPYDLNGLASLLIRHQDINKLDECWAYIPALRRVRRISTSQRDDSLTGDDLAMCDYNCWSDPLGMWNFKILASKQMIMPGYSNEHLRAKDDEGRMKTPRYAGKFIKANFELRPVYLIEAKPIGRRAYSKKIVYVDAETFHIPLAEGYDQGGKIWRSAEFYFCPYSGGKEAQAAYVSFDNYDHQSDHMTVVTGGPKDRVNVGFKAKDYWELSKLPTMGVK
jgi:hypothetical protein